MLEHNTVTVVAASSSLVYHPKFMLIFLIVVLALGWLIGGIYFTGMLIGVSAPAETSFKDWVFGIALFPVFLVVILLALIFSFRK